MEAIQITGYGGNEVVKLVEIPRPQISEGKLLVEVYAAAVNPVDWKIRSGMLKQFMPVQFPMTVGGDFSGKVVEIGDHVSGFEIGDAVFGYANISRGGSGSFAQFALVDPAVIGKKPEKISFTEAAALPMTGVRTWIVLMKYLQVEANQKILIHGGAGGMGIIAVQLAKNAGAYVATTCGAGDISFLKSLGADEVLDYRNARFDELLHGFDAVFDTIGGETFNRSLKVLRKGGKIASMLARPDQDMPDQFQVKFVEQGPEISPGAFPELARVVDEGKVKVFIDRMFPLERAAEALEAQEKDHIRGKIVLTVKHITSE